MNEEAPKWESRENSEEATVTTAADGGAPSDEEILLTLPCSFPLNHIGFVIDRD